MLSSIVQLVIRKTNSIIEFKLLKEKFISFEFVSKINILREERPSKLKVTDSLATRFSLTRSLLKKRLLMHLFIKFYYYMENNLHKLSSLERSIVDELVKLAPLCS